MPDKFRAFNLIGKSPKFKKALDSIDKCSQCLAPVLIHGETGTGKELTARAIHYLSPRKGRPFIPINCGSIPENLIENELFGHVKGAYTGADNVQPGLIAQAQGGTLFLDEIASLPLSAQIVLLRFLQDRHYRPLGGNSLHEADIRIIAASNVDLRLLKKKGKFREDFYYRLDVLRIFLPPLRERLEDLELLSQYFLLRYSLRYNFPEKKLQPQTLCWMQNYHWPGNLRELENFIHRSVLMCEGDAISPPDPVFNEMDSGPLYELPTSDNLKNFKEAKAQALAEFESNYLSRLMTETHGNITEAAKRAGDMDRSALRKLLKKNGINRKSFMP